MFGAFVGGVAAGTLAYSQIKKANLERRDAMTMVPVIVAAQNLAPGDLLTVDVISQRSVPANTVTPSVVTPESSGYVINQRLRVPLLAGDPLWWGHLETFGDWRQKDLNDACSAAIETSHLAPQPERTPAAIRARVLKEAVR